MKISVVIPCFNYGRYVRGAIESVLAQNYEPLEIVIVNDGSTDDSLAVIRSFADRARIIDQPNQGHVPACNAGFAVTSGEVVMFLDADDELGPDALHSVARAWSSGLSKVQFDLRVIDAEGRDLGRKLSQFDEGYTPERVKADFERTGTYRWPVTSGNAYARRYLEAVFPLSVSRAPDGTLNTLAPLYGDVATIPKVHGSYRLHNTNSSVAARDPRRLPAQIAYRRLELDALRAEAAKLGRRLPDEDIMNHELPFLGYRLMALKMDLPYVGRADDNAIRLLLLVGRLFVREQFPLKFALVNVLWLCALAILPRRLATSMVQLRYDRVRYIRVLENLSRYLAGRLSM